MIDRIGRSTSLMLMVFVDGIIVFVRQPEPSGFAVSGGRPVESALGFGESWKLFLHGPSPIGARFTS